MLIAHVKVRLPRQRQALRDVAGRDRVCKPVPDVGVVNLVELGLPPNLDARKKCGADGPLQRRHRECRRLVRDGNLFERRRWDNWLALDEVAIGPLLQASVLELGNRGIAVSLPRSRVA